jgi:Nucleoside 2-deoxyribosyltransferase
MQMLWICWYRRACRMGRQASACGPVALRGGIRDGLCWGAISWPFGGGSLKVLNIYIASSFDEASLCESIRLRLEDCGMKIPDVWWNIKTKDNFVNESDTDFYSTPIVQAIAARHWETIRECDAVILVSSLKERRSFTGANVEVGFAFALSKPVFSIGELKRSAMYSPIIKCRSIHELMDSILCLAQIAR